MRFRFRRSSRSRRRILGLSRGGIFVVLRMSGRLRLRRPLRVLAIPSALDDRRRTRSSGHGEASRVVDGAGVPGPR